jgi:hypothetical protein
MLAAVTYIVNTSFRKFKRFPMREGSRAETGACADVLSTKVNFNRVQIEKAWTMVQAFSRIQKLSRVRGLSAFSSWLLFWPSFSP